MGHKDVLTRKKKKQATILLQQNRYFEAGELLISVCKTNRADVGAWLMLATVYQKSGAYVNCENCCRQILTIQPSLTEALVLLGNAVECQGRFAEAIEYYRRGVAVDPACAEAYYFMGNAYRMLQLPDNAVDCYRKSVELKPNYFEALNNLGAVFRIQGRLIEAMGCFQRALRLSPNTPQLMHNIGLIYLWTNQVNEAIEILRASLSTGANQFDSHYLLAQAYIATNELNKALDHLKTALTIQPGHPSATAALASIYERRADIDNAYQAIKPFISANQKITPEIATVFCSLSVRFGLQAQAIEITEKLLTQDINQKSRIDCHYEIGKLYDYNGDYDNAFRHYKAANDSYRAFNSDFLQKWDDGLTQRQFKVSISECGTEFWSVVAGKGSGSEQPIFVVGMPRSGTTLTEQILASHPEVHGAGELRGIYQIANDITSRFASQAEYPACLKFLEQADLEKLAEGYCEILNRYASGKTRVVDKMPGNFLHLGLISILFPKARIIHVVRDPADTCLSIYFQKFSVAFPYACDLEALGAYYRQYHQLMEHWKRVLAIPILDVTYEQLVQDLEGVSRRMIEFCDLQWDERCLSFHDTRRDVDTPSYAQVRQPIYKRSIGRWKHYENYLGPLFEVLGDPYVRSP